MPSALASAMVDGDSVVICLAVYTALSLLWTVARLTHIWWTGPTGGRFHPDVIATWLFVTAIQYLWAQCKSRYVSCSTGESSSAAQSARVAKLRAYISRNLNREGNTDTQEEETPSRTGLQGPSFHLVDMSGAVDANRDQVAQPTGPFISVPTICLNARIEQWVEESADSGRNSAPRMHCIPLSLFVTMKFVQKLAFSSFADVSWNFLWLVPTIMFDEVPAAVDIRIDALKG